MERLVKKYVTKLIQSGLCKSEDIFLAGLDAEIYWNQEQEICNELTQIIHQLNISSLLFAKPAEPYRAITAQLFQNYQDVLIPSDTESRTFLHEIRILPEFDLDRIIETLKQNKCVIIKNIGIITTGSITPEQCFVTYSSVCFACFVKYFYDFYERITQKSKNLESIQAFKKINANCDFYHQKVLELQKGPLVNDEQVINAMIEAGKLTIDFQLVDSYFGNLSYFDGSTIFISQSGSSMDELGGYIDPVPINQSKTIGLTASSELSAHQAVYQSSDFQVILHGHPKFAVVLSMLCEKKECINRGECHIKCTEERTIAGVPVVPGEVGNGPHGLCHTMPDAIRNSGTAVVYGHGVFVGGTVDYNEAFKKLFNFEKKCHSLYLKKIKEII